MFLADERPHLTCCQNATDEELDTDPDTFDCQTCPVAEAYESLYPENAEALAIFQQVGSRFVVDLQAGGAVLARLTQDYSANEMTELIERLTVLYDILSPPKDPHA